MVTFVRIHRAALLAGLLIGAFAAASWFEHLEYWSLSRLFELRGARAPSLPIVIVGVDQSTLHELNEQWPFARRRHADLIRAITPGKPRAIVLDLNFDEPSLRGPADDAQLADAIASAGNVVLAAVYGIDVQPFYRRDGLNMPIAKLRRRAAAVGLVKASTESDGQIHRVPVRLALPVGEMPTLIVAIHGYLANLGVRGAPLPRSNDVLINYRGGPNTFPWISYYRVLRGEIPVSYWQDKIVLVGLTSPILHDVFATPFARHGGMPGVEILANELETLMTGNRIREVSMGVSAVLAVVLALVGSVIAVHVAGARSALLAGALWVAVSVTTFVAFAVFNVWIHALPLSVALALGYTGRCVDSAKLGQAAEVA
jgi:CHASE2 domain-containing sensor protein